MKDYDHVVVWLDYFNKTLTRSRGRRLPKGSCVFDPSLKELADAAAGAGLEVSASDEKVRFPRRPYVRSGYIVLPKGGPKSGALGRIAAGMVAARSRRQQGRK